MILAHSFHRGAGGVRREWIMKRVILLWVAISLCSAALALRAEEQPLATRVDHFFVESDRAHSLFTFFKDTFQLPEMWPFSDRETHASGGLWLGNAVLEFATFPANGDKPVKTEFRGIAFEPGADYGATAAELAKRNIPHYSEARSRKSQVPGRQILSEWSIVTLMDFPPANADIFFVDYKDRRTVAQRQRKVSDDLVARNGGPLGIVRAAEITVGVQALEEARSKWSALFAPSPQISDNAFVFESGPRIHLVRAESPGIQGIVLKVCSLDRAAKFLEERGLLAKDDSGCIAISPAAIDGLSIRLIDDSQAEGSGNRLLGTGRGVDHVGIGVRNLDKAKRDYEQVLGFKCTENLPPISGALRSIILFDDETLLEFLSPPQPASAVNSDYLRYLADFVEKHEGAMSLALETSSAKGAAAYLSAHNFEVKISEWPTVMKEGEPKPSPVQYYSVSTPDTPSGNKQTFMLWIWLIEHVGPERPAKLAARREQGMMTHPNIAQRLHSAWFAVHDLDASLRNLRDAGFEPGESREAKFLGASGREIKAGIGRLLLLRSADKNSALNKFLSDHDDGDIIGISIEVADLRKARSWIEGHFGQELEPYGGFYGQSILIPPDLTHGVWMELFQR
jgi:catechol 2,3-dioxygenase-like lactoylglutathione lyase family enzyme